MYSTITSNSEMRIRCFPNIYDIPKALLNPTPDLEKPLPVISTTIFKLHIMLSRIDPTIRYSHLENHPYLHFLFLWPLITLRCRITDKEWNVIN